MGKLSYERHCAEIIHQAELLVSALDGADLGIQVPSCPDWTVNQLLRHVGFAYRWADEMIREKRPEIDFTRNAALDVSAYAGETAAELGPWIEESARSLASALQAVDPDEMIATLASHPGPRLWSRRMAQECVIHRWDAVNALGVPFEIDADMAADNLTEWALFALPFAFLRWPAETAALVGPGHTIHLHATDFDCELVLDLTGPRPAVREGHEKAAVAVRGPVTELMLAVYRRRPVEGLEVFGDRELLDRLLTSVRF
ncbi:maleylpyruvate isomerase family mycothiol-dependent enzyme [Lentzea kentuckyensis]|uniref:maleylpyruvate isomerase family mycothiol-dependent enzyme n=1 Tax=Lentzea kentuckyensis TaxID=360086 RepID=UPI001302C9EC|nr:maleylpyruvate isomerase family mycothiol-dependent enzyme [Lentzea kentuckyensis]